jgi:hypothetical protein
MIYYLDLHGFLVFSKRFPLFWFYLCLEEKTFSLQKKTPIIGRIFLDDTSCSCMQKYFDKRAGIPVTQQGWRTNFIRGLLYTSG